jgi:hypothetical protein
MTRPHQQFEQGLQTIRSALGTALNQKGVRNASISYSIPGSPLLCLTPPSRSWQMGRPKS